MAIPLTAPPHISRPNMARQIVAWHRHFDMSAWIMATGKEVLCMQGKIVEGGPRARDDIFAYNRGSPTRTAALVLALYKIDLLAKG